MLRERFFQALHRLDFERQEQLIGDGISLRVEGREEGRNELFIRQMRRHREGAHIRHAAVAHDDHRKLGAVSLREEAHHVLVDILGDSDALIDLRALDRTKLIAIDRGLFKRVRGRRLTHAHRQIVGELLLAPIEKEPDEPRLREVRIPIDLVHAGCRAALDLMLQAGTNATREVCIATGAQLEMPVHQAQRFACGTR